MIILLALHTALVLEEAAHLPWDYPSCCLSSFKRDEVGTIGWDFFGLDGAACYFFCWVALGWCRSPRLVPIADWTGCLFLVDGVS